MVSMAMGQTQQGAPCEGKGHEGGWFNNPEELVFQKEMGWTRT